MPKPTSQQKGPPASMKLFVVQMTSRGGLDKVLCQLTKLFGRCVVRNGNPVIQLGAESELLLARDVLHPYVGL